MHLLGAVLQTDEIELVEDQELDKLREDNVDAARFVPGCFQDSGSQISTRLHSAPAPGPSKVPLSSGLFSLYKYPVSILCPYSNRPLSPLTGVWQGLFGCTLLI